MKALKRTSKKTEPKPENFKTKKEAEEAAEEYIKSQPIYTVINIFGGPNHVKTVKGDIDGVLPKY